MDSTSKICFRRALIVDHSTPIRRTLVRLASTWAREVVPTGSLREAMAELVHAPDLLITDVQLPDGSIVDLLESEAWRRSRAIAIAVSGRVPIELAFRLGQLGVDSFLSKPFGLRDLEKVLETAAVKKRAQKPRVAATTPFEAQLRAFARMHKLTEPQTALLRALLCGTSRKRLAETLGISENTCKKTVRRLLARCRAQRVADVVGQLMAQGISASSAAEQ